MTIRNEDRQFRLWQEHGDPDALARVFDLTAPKLMLVALHVSKNSARAEDLVQTTFLHAIRDAASWDSAQPLFGWLSGILSHRALDEFRRARVRKMESLDPDTGAGREASPLQATLDRELVQTVTQRIDGLPGPYREVLVLRLVHGLEPVEIAHSLKRAPGTVRMQLKRGLERLREDLPKGIALPSVLALDPALGLDVIKQSVLSKATSIQVASIVSTSSPSIGALMTTKAWMVVLAVGALVAGLWTLPDDGLDGRDLEGTAVGPDVVLAANDRNAAMAPPADSLSSASVVREGAPRTSVERERQPELQLRVRVCYESTDNPAAGVGIHLLSSGNLGPGRQQVTDGTGVALFGGLRSSTYRILLDRGGEFGFDVTEDGNNELGIVLPLGIRVAGRVIDLENNPVAGARIYRVQETHPDYLHEIAETDRDGRFVLTNVPLGSKFVARAEHYQPSEYERAHAVSEETSTLELVLGARGHEVTGTVLDANGMPAGPVLVAIAVDEDARESLDGPSLQDVRNIDRRASKRLDRETILVRAESDGTFRSGEVPRGSAFFMARSVDIDNPGIGTGMLLVQAGTTNVITLRLSPGAEVYGRVLDTTGRPYADLLILATWDGNETFGSLEDELGPLYGDRATFTGRDGSFRLTDLLPGEHDLYVGTGNETLLRDGIVLATGESALWNPVLEPRSDLVVRVVDDHGAPLVGWGVALVRPRDLHHDGWVRPRRSDAQGRLRSKNLEYQPLTVRIYRPDADDGGMAQLACAVVQGVLPGPEELVIEVGPKQRRSARLYGRLADASARPLTDARIRLSRIGSGDRLNVKTSQSDGSFDFGALPEGTYEIESAPRGYPKSMHGPWILKAGEERDLGTLRLAEPNHLIVYFGLPNGSALVDPEISLIAEPSDHESWGVGGRWKNQLEWHSWPIPDGTYTLQMWAPNAAPLTRTIEVTGGGQTRERVTCERGHARELVVTSPKYVEGLSDRRSLNEARIDLLVRDAGGATLVDDRWTKPYDDRARRIGRFHLRLAAGAYTVTVSQPPQPDGTRPSVQLEVTFGTEYDSPIAVDLR